MCAFDLGNVEKARSVPDEGAAGEGAAWNRLKATFIERARAVGDAAAAVEDGREERVVLHALELAVGGEVRVGVVLQEEGVRMR